MKKILVLAAGYYNQKVIQELRNAGFFVLAVDMDPKAEGFKYAHTYKPINIVDRDKVLEYAIGNKIDAIMPVNEFGVKTACYVSHKMNLVGNSLLTGVCAIDKGIMRDVWASEGLPQPNYIVIENLVDNFEQNVKRVVETLQFPVVVKPTDSGGAGRGITIANTKNDINDSFEYAHPYVKNNRIIVEEMIRGTEMTIDALSYKGQIHFLSLSDKEKPEQRFRVATGLNFPAKFPDSILENVKEIVEKAVMTLGIKNGASHTEVIVQQDGTIKLLELGARGGGGHVFHTIIRENTGVNYPVECGKILCGDVPDLNHTRNVGVVYRFFNPPKNGKIKSIQYDENVIKQDFVADFGITAQKGDEFNGLVNSMHRVGYVVTTGRNREEAITNADIIEENVFFEIE